MSTCEGRLILAWNGLVQVANCLTEVFIPDAGQLPFPRRWWQVNLLRLHSGWCGHESASAFMAKMKWHFCQPRLKCIVQFSLTGISCIQSYLYDWMQEIAVKLEKYLGSVYQLSRVSFLVFLKCMIFIHISDCVDCKEHFLNSGGALGCEQNNWGEWRLSNIAHHNYAWVFNQAEYCVSFYLTHQHVGIDGSEDAYACRQTSPVQSSLGAMAYQDGEPFGMHLGTHRVWSGWMWSRNWHSAH